MFVRLLRLSIFKRLKRYIFIYHLCYSRSKTVQISADLIIYTTSSIISYSNSLVAFDDVKTRARHGLVSRQSRDLSSRLEGLALET